MKERTFKKMIFAVFCCQFLSIPLFAQQQKVDTTHTYSIPEITVSDIYQTREVRSTAPLQVFSKDALKNRLSLKPWGIALKFLFLHHENILFPND